MACRLLTLALAVCAAAAAGTLRHTHLGTGNASFALGGGAPGPSPAPGPAPAGMCGCEKRSDCTCGGSLDYLQCVHEACEKGCGECDKTSGPWSNQCTTLITECNDEISLGCHNSIATCEGKFHQATYGVEGLTLSTSHLNEEAYCGPWGKCMGELHLAADLHKPAADTKVECVVPVAMDDPETVYHSRGEVKDMKSSIKLPMLKELPKGGKVEGRCYLIDGKGSHASKDAFFIVQNHYDADFVATDGKKEEKKEAKKEAPATKREIKKEAYANSKEMGAASTRTLGLVAAGAAAALLSF
eukprot:gnl/TRDRNA2_/TRDRNA2_182982_c0_seq1.p1 gnl/TRDRNA2_/TRDRNA2_182982_c0~~gnl/TRDRNA2_/TRDRNA2_182982_c0_seq1.p1  ORF type:complete len:300 (-),score=84.72 gnl/TRDRNA2_/TRDRNA2_182982_c0_seq1:49-948(-)